MGGTGSCSNGGYQEWRRVEHIVREKSPDGFGNLTTLNLCDCDICSVPSAAALGRLLGDKCPGVETLNFEGNDLGGHGVLATLDSGVGDTGFPSLRTLVLADCGLETGEATEGLGRLIGRRCPRLETLELQTNPGFGGPDVLAGFVRGLGGWRSPVAPPRLTTLDLQSCGIRSRDAAGALGLLLAALASTLQVLTLNGNPLGGEGVLEALRNGVMRELPVMRVLNMKLCGVAAADPCGALGRLLAARCPGLQVLNLGLGVHGMVPTQAVDSTSGRTETCGALEALEAGFGETGVLPELAELMLWDTDVRSPAAARALGRLLGIRFPKLHTVNLAGSRLESPKAWEALREGLGNHILPGLSTLWLEECGLASAAVASAMASVLSSKCPGLRDLRLSYNNLGGHGILVVFGVGLGDKGLPLLERLDLRSNDVDTTEAGIKRLLPSCRALKDVWGCRVVRQAEYR